jgi:hypothetical protein
MLRQADQLLKVILLFRLLGRRVHLASSCPGVKQVSYELCQTDTDGSRAPLRSLRLLSRDRQRGC